MGASYQSWQQLEQQIDPRQLLQSLQQQIISWILLQHKKNSTIQLQSATIPPMIAQQQPAFFLDAGGEWTTTTGQQP